MGGRLSNPPLAIGTFLEQSEASSPASMRRCLIMNNCKSGMASTAQAPERSGCGCGTQANSKQQTAAASCAPPPRASSLVLQCGLASLAGRFGLGRVKALRCETASAARQHMVPKTSAPAGCPPPAQSTVLPTSCVLTSPLQDTCNRPSAAGPLCRHRL